MRLLGTYNRNGYEITDADDSEGALIYVAGNNPHDSTASLPIGDGDALRLDTLAEYCEASGKSLAVEHSCQWLGCQQVADDGP